MIFRQTMFWGVVFATIGLAGEVSHAGDIMRSRPVGVVELFTSQGCSSCPKADAALEKLAEHPDLVAISYHVDYWNYLGWEDTLGEKENTERQYAYAKSLGHTNVYTPQMVLNGIADIKEREPSRIVQSLKTLARNGKGPAVPVDATLTPEEMTIRIGAGEGKADVVVAYFRKMTRVEITRGENEGKMMSYRNAVTSLQTVGMWEGKEMEIKLPAAMVKKEGHDGCAILLQSHDADGNPGRIYGASAL